MKLTLWTGLKLSAWLITSFLGGLMIVVYIMDFKDLTMNIMFYFNKIFIIIFMWILLYLSKFIYNKLSTIKNIRKK